MDFEPSEEQRLIADTAASAAAISIIESA